MEVSSEPESDFLQETDEVPDSSTWTPAKAIKCFQRRDWI